MEHQLSQIASFIFRKEKKAEIERRKKKMRRKARHLLPALIDIEQRPFRVEQNELYMVNTPLITEPRIESVSLTRKIKEIV